MRKKSNWKSPSRPVVFVMTAPVSSWVSVTVAPGAAAPVGSVTVPANVAVVTCAQLRLLKTSRLASKNKKNLPDVIAALLGAIRQAGENVRIPGKRCIRSPSLASVESEIDGRYHYVG